jgi:PTS system mannose-specific IID component
VAAGEADARAIGTFKVGLMGSLGAIGDSFFWGALRPFAGIAAVCLAIAGFFLAPLMLLVLYNPVHLWVRIRGFITGWRQGQNAIDFIRRLDLPEMSRRIRWGSTILLAVAAYLASTAGPFHDLLQPGLPGQVGGLLVVLASLLAVRKGISPLAILYGSVTFFAVVMMMR